MDIGDWLRRLGLGRYETSFRENAVDAAVLLDLTDPDLEKLGVLLGHRKQLLKAIAGLKHSAGEPRPSGPATKVDLKLHDAAERRLLTVMFCDLVGSTAMSARLDPEDMHAIIAAYHKCCATLITGNGGFVAKYMGDGVLAYFGYPRANEHDAENAVRAGLAIVDAAPKLQTLVEEPLHVRVGIATGIVVVGDLLGSGDAQERGVVGDTPNLAARLQGIAEPDTVVIAQGTRNLTGGLFDLRDLGPHALKGVPGETRVLVAIGKGVQESRFEALHASGMTELIGREEQCELLLRCWAKSKGGDGQVVILAGEPGIGKSRLTMALLERIAAEPHVRLRYFCSPQHTYSSLYPIVAQLERAAGFAREDTAGSKLDKLDGLLARTATSQDDAAIIAEMLSLPNDGRYPALDLAPRQRRQRTLQALTDQIEKIARRCPLLIVFEDAHWSDPSSLELFDGLVDGINALPILLCVTSRPEFAAPWIGRPHVSALRARSAGTRRCDRYHRPHRRRPVDPGEYQGVHRRAHRRRASVRRGDDKGGSRGQGRGIGEDSGIGSLARSGGPVELARFADGSARSIGRRQGRGSNWCRDWPGVLPRASSFRGPRDRRGVWLVARTSH